MKRGPLLAGCFIALLFISLKNKISAKEGEWSGHFSIIKVIDFYPRKVIYVGGRPIIYAQHFDVKKIYKVVLKSKYIVEGKEIEEVHFFHSETKQHYVEYFYILNGGIVNVDEIDWIIYR